MKYNVTLEMEVEAESSVDALNIGIGAAEHLNDTFNDDESINPLMKVVGARPKRRACDAHRIHSRHHLRKLNKLGEKL